MNRDEKERKRALKRIKKDAIRPLRRLKTLDPGSVLENSPVEMRSGEVISDRETGEIFLHLNFRSLSEKPLLSFRARVLLYREGLCIPYDRYEKVYAWEAGTLGRRTRNGAPLKKREEKTCRLIENGEVFGEGVFLPLPDSYFSKIEIELLECEDGEGNVLPIMQKAGGSLGFDELTDELKDTYTRMNIFRDAEQVRPIRVLPKEGENAWQCCCGAKNPVGNTHCELCGREKEWQMAHLTMENLRSVRLAENRNTNVRVLHDKTAYAPRMESEEELKRKEEECKKILQKVEIQQKEQENRKTRLFVRFLLWFVIVAALSFLIAFVLKLMRLYGITGSEEQSTAAQAMITLVGLRK